MPRDIKLCIPEDDYVPAKSRTLQSKNLDGYRFSSVLASLNTLRIPTNPFGRQVNLRKTIHACPSSRIRNRDIFDFLQIHRKIHLRLTPPPHAGQDGIILHCAGLAHSPASRPPREHLAHDRLRMIILTMSFIVLYQSKV